MAAKRGRSKAHQWFYDFETVNWHTPRLCVVQRDDGEQSVFWGEDAAEKVAALQRQEGGTWVAHAGGIFDHLLCWRDSTYPEEIILTGSSVLKATDFKKAGRAPLIWRDSHPRWLCSLAKIGNVLGAPKGDVDRSNIAAVPADELLRYCARDVEILRRGWLAEDEWLARYKVKAYTSGSAAVKLLEAMDPDSWRALDQNMVDPAVSTGIVPALDGEGYQGHPSGSVAGALDAVRGGRTETRRVGLVKGPVYVYDLHSSYPSQYQKGALPVGCEPTLSRNLDDWGWLDWCSWYQPARPDPRSTAFELSDDGRGVGPMSAWLTWETAHALKARGFNVQRHGIGWKPTGRVLDFASSFVRELFRLKEGGGLEATWAKVTVNSLHGKAGEKPFRFRYLQHSQPEPGTGLTGGWLQHFTPEAAYTKPAPYQQPLLAAAVLQRARLTLSRAIEAVESAGFEFYYCDTDSVHTNCPPEAFRQILPLGPDLGAWGLETCADEAIYLAPKTYWLSGGKTAAKGMPKDVITRAHFLAAAEGGDVPLSREGLGRLRQGEMSGLKVSLTRTLRPVYHGRERVLDGVLRYL